MRLASLLLAALSLLAQDPPEPLRVLFLGNSYTHTNDMPGMLASLANALPGRQLEVKSVTRGGATLADLWTLTNAAEVLRNGKWDIVVLQDYSTLGQNFVNAKWNINDPAGTWQWMKIWNYEIQRKQAKPMLYLTWARKAQPEFQTGLNYAYSEAARELNAQLAPVGLAWKRLRETQPGLELFVADGSHPSPLGTYLTACVFLEALLGKTCAPPAKPPTIVRISPEAQTQIADAAHFALEELKAGALTGLPRPDYGTLKPLPTPTDTKPEDFQGIWKGKAAIYSGMHEMKLDISVQGRVCKGTITLDNPGMGYKLVYPLTTCTIDQVTLLFAVSDPRQIIEEFKAVIDGGKLVGTHQLRDTNPYRRIMGSFELKKD
jgi:hypothetical protein